MVTSNEVITTRLDRFITLARTTTMVGIFTSGANSNIGMLPALSTEVVENRSRLNCKDALTSEWNSILMTLFGNVESM